MYVITEFPAISPLIKPVLDTLALAGVPDIQALFAAAVPLPVNCNVAPTHKLFPPVIVGLDLP